MQMLFLGGSHNGERINVYDQPNPNYYRLPVKDDRMDISGVVNNKIEDYRYYQFWVFTKIYEVFVLVDDDPEILIMNWLEKCFNE